mgnify:CR=1 FL=1
MDNQDLNRLHQATLDILKRYGVRVESPKALPLFKNAGIRTDDSAMRVYPAEQDIERALGTVPKTFNIYRQDSDIPLTIGNDQHYILSGGGSVRVRTLDGQYEQATWDHLRQFNRLLDALPNIHILLNQVDPQGDQPTNYYKLIAAEMFLGTRKPCCLQANGEQDIQAMVEMASIIAGGKSELKKRPIFLTGSNSEPPLCIPKHATEIHIAASRSYIPTGLGDYAMMGVTSPITLAGTLAQRNAVQMVSLILSQLAQPGAPFYYTATSGSTDMRTLNPIMADPRVIKILKSSAELGKYYNLPIMGIATTDSKSPDAQAAVERAICLQVSMDAGVHIIQGPTSMMDQMMLSCFVQTIIDHDIIGYLLAAHNKPIIDEENLALDVIGDIIRKSDYGAMKFAIHDHTSKHMRDETWQPMCFDYRSFTEWQAAGSPHLIERAKSVAHRILNTHVPNQLEEAIQKEIMRIATE